MQSILAPTFVLAAFAALAGCAEDSSDSGGLTSNQSGGAGQGGFGPGGGGSGGVVGGGGGAGGFGLCDQDCSAIVPPTCYVSVCNDGSYPGTIGSCVVVPAADGATCEDGLFCTANDACEEGTCVGGPQNTCGLVAEPCQGVVCDEGAQACDFAPSDEGAPCIGDELCVVNTTCQNGTCGAGSPKDCTFAPVPDDCHVSECNPLNGMCEPVPGNDGLECDDSNDLCIVNKVCDAGQCVDGSPKDCSALTQGCDVGTCDDTTGNCVAMTVADGQVCDDLDACTTGETCSAGTCSMGTPITSCSLVDDGCCPSNCDELNDSDCDCPGVEINGTCVYLTSPSTSYQLPQAQAVCQALGTGWDLCPPSQLCTSEVYSYLGAQSCDCDGGDTTCSCGSTANVYVHVSGGASPYYIQSSLISGCSGSTCTNSVLQSCGVALCCK